MKKRIVSLMLAIVFTITTFPSMVFAAEHANINYDEIKYEHVDAAEFYNAVYVITQSADKNNYSSVESMIIKLVDFWCHVDTQYTLEQYCNPRMHQM